MILVIIFTALSAIGVALCIRNKEGDVRVIVGISLIGVAGLALVSVLLGILTTHVNSKAEISDFNMTRGVVASINTGDPSYSGILMDALKKNSQLAVAKDRNPSLWWDWFYNDEYCKLKPILMPGQK